MKKSTPVPHDAVAAMQRHLADGNTELPLVIPLLFYHGQVSPYPYTLCWLDLFSDRPLAEKLYTHDFPLADVTVIPDDAIMQHRRVAILELIQKHIRSATWLNSQTGWSRCCRPQTSKTRSSGR